MQDVLPELLRFIGSRPLIGYWIDFDVRMLDKYLIETLNIHLPNRRIDVSKLYYDRNANRSFARQYPTRPSFADAAATRRLQ